MTDRKIRKKDCVRLSNKIIERCSLSVPPVSSIGDIKSDIFVALLQVLCGQLPPGVNTSPSSPEDEVNNVQAIINHLALDLINVDLSHITGDSIIAGNPRAIYNLLEIFCGLHKYLSSTDVDKWHLEESLTETEEELSSGSSSSEKQSEDEPLVTADDEVAPEDDDAAEKAPTGLPPSGSRASLPRSGSGSGSPAKRRSSEVANTSSGSVAGATTTSSTTEGSTTSPTTTSATPDTTSSSKTGGSEIGGASAVSFPESVFSLDKELPMSPPGSQPAVTAASPSPPLSPVTSSTPVDVAPDSSGIIPSDITPSDPGFPPDTPTSGDSPGSGETGGQEATTEGSGDSEESAEAPTGEEVRKPTKPFIPRHFDFVESETVVDEVDHTEDETEAEDEEDMSRELSDELQQLKTSSGTEPSSEPKEPTPPTTTAEPTTTDDSALQLRPRQGKSAPCTPAAKMAASRRLRRRLQSCSSASDPGVGQMPPGRRLLTRNVETLAEIHESGGERATCQTTREQKGDELCREIVRREVRRKVHSAPQPTRLASYSKQSSRRSICSDGVLQWLESQADDTHLKVQGEETDVFEFLRREFPYVHVSEETKRKLLHEYRQQMRYIMSLTEPTETRKYKLKRQDVLRRQSLLTDIMRQQKAHDRRFRCITDQKRCEIRSRNAPRDNKIACLRAERYVDSFKQQFQSRMALNKSREELLLKGVFEEMLEIQRRRLRTVRRMEKKAITDFYGENGYTSDLNRMHQFYEANFRDLSQLLSRERQDLKISEKEQMKLADRIRREFRDYMESDVHSLNDKIVNSWQPQYKELDADRIRSDLYQAKWKFCVT